MKNEIMFIIGEKTLYLEEVLVEYDYCPIFFVCYDDKEKYICLCADIDENFYIVTKTENRDIVNMLHGRITMRSLFTKEDIIWKIISGEEVSQDIVEQISQCELDQSVLPIEEGYYEIVDSEIQDYCNKLEKSVCMEDKWENVKISLEISVRTLDNAKNISQQYKKHIEYLEKIYKYSRSLSLIKEKIYKGEDINLYKESFQTNVFTINQPKYAIFNKNRKSEFVSYKEDSFVPVAA